MDWRASGLDGLQNGQQVLRCGAQCIECFHHFRQLGRGGQLDQFAGLLLDVDGGFFGHHGLSTRQGVGLADDGGGRNADGQVAVGNGAGAQRDRLVEHDGAGARVDDDLGGANRGLHGQLFHLGNEAHAAIGVGGGLDLHSAAVQGLGHAVTKLAVHGLGHLAGGLEVRGAQAQVDGVAFLQRGGYRALHLGAFGDAAHAEVVDGDLAATSGGARAGHDQVALGKGIDFAISAFERCADQRAALERLGVTQGRDVDVEGLSWTGEGGQLGGDQHRGHIFHLQLGQLRRGQGQPELAHVIGQALGGVGHLRGLVACAVQAHHQTEAGQLVAANALDAGHFLDPGRMGRAGQGQQARYRQACQGAQAGPW